MRTKEVIKWINGVLDRIVALESHARNTEQTLSAHQKDIDRLSRENNELRQTVASVEYHLGLGKQMSDAHWELDNGEALVEDACKRYEQLESDSEEDVIEQLSRQVNLCHQQLRNLETELELLRMFKELSALGSPTLTKRFWHQAEEMLK